MSKLLNSFMPGEPTAEVCQLNETGKSLYRNNTSRIPTPHTSPNVDIVSRYRDREEVSCNSCNNSEISLDLLRLEQKDLALLPLYYRQQFHYLDQARQSSLFSRIENYASQVALIATSDTNASARMVGCVKASRSGKKFGRCDKKRLCPYCARREGKNIGDKFQSAFPKSTWGHLTISYSGSFGFDSIDHNAWRRHWDAPIHALKRLCDVGLLPGAIAREELHLESYVPQHTLPHVHAIVSTDSWTPEMEARLKRFMEGYRDDEGEGIELEPNFHFKAISDEKEFRNTIYYIEKAVDLVAPYERFFYQHPNPPAQSIRGLNRACRDFIESYLAGTEHKQQVHYAGNMHANSKIFLGTRSSKSTLTKKRSSRKKGSYNSD